MWPGPAARGRGDRRLGAAAEMERAGDDPDSPPQVSVPTAAYRAPLCVLIGTRAMSSGRLCARPCVCVCVCVCVFVPVPVPVCVCARARSRMVLRAAGRLESWPASGRGQEAPQSRGCFETRPGWCWPGRQEAEAGSQQLPAAGRALSSPFGALPPTSAGGSWRPGVRGQHRCSGSPRLVPKPRGSSHWQVKCLQLSLEAGG